jgi:hypothetical protein
MKLLENIMNSQVHVGLLLPTMQQFHQPTSPTSILIGLNLEETLPERLKGEF